MINLMRKKQLLRKWLLSKEILIIVIITLLGLSIRAWKLTSSPSSLYIDETNIGYNAFSIIKTGRDEHGEFMPLFFKSFGDYKPPLYIYEVVLAQFFLGPTDLSVRIPAVLVGSLTIPVFFYLSKELLSNVKNKIVKKYVPLLSSFLLATSPWHIQFTRPAFGACLIVFFYSLGLFLFLLAIRKKSTIFLTSSLISFVLTMYAYYSPRIVTPLILFFLLTFFFKKFSLYSWLISFFIAGFISLPVVTFAFTGEGLARAKQISIFYHGSDKPKLQQIFLNYWTNISPSTLFIKGSPVIDNRSLHRMSLIYLVELPFFITGLLILARGKNLKYFLVLIAFFIGFIPSALTTDIDPHSLRSFSAMPFSAIISSSGLVYFISKFKKGVFRRVVLGLYFLLILISTIKFLSIYHNKYVKDSGWDWQVGIKRSVLRISLIQNNYDNIYFADGISKIAVCWYLKCDPKIYQETTDKNNIGKYHFEKSWMFISHTGKNLYVTSGDVPNGRLLEIVYYPNGRKAYGIWEI